MKPPSRTSKFSRSRAANKYGGRAFNLLQASWLHFAINGRRILSRHRLANQSIWVHGSTVISSASWRKPLLILAGLLVASPLWAANSAAPLTADQIIQKAVKRSAADNLPHARPNYNYENHTVVDKLDSNGRLKEHTEKMYEVVVDSGLSYLKLLQVNGQNLSPAQLKKQDERDIAERQKMTDAGPGKKGDEREIFLNADLAARYKFTLVEQKVINGRNAYVLAFSPKSGDLPVHKLTDRLFNNIAGKLWIDAEDFEIARAEAHLQSEITLWGGIIGTLKQSDFTLERVRLPEGVWFSSYTHGYFEGRKLLEPIVYRTRTQSSHFRRATLAAMK
jgi:hypothetical protein